MYATALPDPHPHRAREKFTTSSGAFLRRIDPRFPYQPSALEVFRSPAIILF
jgi:hypothetical protein